MVKVWTTDIVLKTDYIVMFAWCYSLYSIFKRSTSHYNLLISFVPICSTELLCAKLSSTVNMWGRVACSIILMDRWDAVCWTEGQRGTDACRSSVEIRPVSSCNYNGNSTIQMDAFCKRVHQGQSTCLWELTALQRLRKAAYIKWGTGIISLLRLQPLTSSLMPGDHTLMLLSPAFDSAIMFQNSHFNTTWMKPGTCLPCSSAGQHWEPCCSDPFPHSYTNREKRMQHTRGNNAELLWDWHLIERGVWVKQREMLRDDVSA